MNKENIKTETAVRLQQAIELGVRNIRCGTSNIGSEAISLAIAVNRGEAWEPGCCMGQNICYVMERDQHNRFRLRDGFKTVREAISKMSPIDVLILPIAAMSDGDGGNLNS